MPSLPFSSALQWRFSRGGYQSAVGASALLFHTLLFTSAAAAGSNQFVIISDTQNIEGVDRMTREIIELRPPFAIAVGDMPSAFDSRVNLFRRLREAGIELHIAMGNHDGDTRSALRSCLPPYPFNSWVDPVLLHVVENRYYYSFNSLGIHFVIVDTCAGNADQQTRWLEADLVRHVNNPRKLPSLLFMHYPEWMLGKESRSGGPVYQVLAAHPDAHTVKAAFAGHTHDGKLYPLEDTLQIPLYTLYPSAPFGSVNQTEYVVATVKPDEITFERRVVLDDGKGSDFVIHPVKGRFPGSDK